MALKDINAVKRNIVKLRDAGAPDEDIDAYVQEEGYTPEQILTPQTPGPSYGQKVLEDAKQTAGALLNPVQIFKSGQQVGKAIAGSISGDEASKEELKQMGQAALDPIFHPIRNIKEGKLASTALALAPGVGLAGKAVKSAAGSVLPSLARRGLGYEGGMLTKPGALERATDVGMASLEKGVMPLGGSIKGALKNAETLAEKTGKRIDGIRQEVSASAPSSFDVVSLLDEVKAQIEPTLLASDKKLLSRVINDIKKEIPKADEFNPYANFMDATKLVKKLQEKGKFKPLSQGSDAVSAEVYQRASGIARQMLDDAVEKAGNQLGKPELIAEYNALKKTYGQTQDMITVLNNKLGKLSGNNSIGLISATLGGTAGIASHNPLLGAAVVAGSEIAKRRPGMIAQGVRGIKGAGNVAGKALNPLTVGAGGLTLMDIITNRRNK